MVEELLIALGRRGQAVCLGLPLVLRLQVPGIQGTYRWIRGGGTGANNYIFLTFANSKELLLFLISYGLILFPSFLNLNLFMIWGNCYWIMMDESCIFW